MGMVADFACEMLVQSSCLHEAVVDGTSALVDVEISHLFYLIVGCLML